MCTNTESSEETSRLDNDLVGVDPYWQHKSKQQSRPGLQSRVGHGSGLSAQSVFHLMSQSVQAVVISNYKLFILTCKYFVFMITIH